MPICMHVHVCVCANMSARCICTHIPLIFRCLRSLKNHSSSSGHSTLSFVHEVNGIPTVQGRQSMQDRKLEASGVSKLTFLEVAYFLCA